MVPPSSYLWSLLRQIGGQRSFSWPPETSSASPPTSHFTYAHDGTCSNVCSWVSPPPALTKPKPVQLPPAGCIMHLQTSPQETQIAQRLSSPNALQLSPSVGSAAEDVQQL